MKNLISKEEKDQIDLICEEFGIKNYSINSDGSIDVKGDVNLADSGLIVIPVKFNNVSGVFRCDSNGLKSLVGSPKNVGGDFDCEDNMLTSLVGCPAYVGGYFDITYNVLTSTYAGDTDIEVSGIIRCISDVTSVNSNHLPQQLVDNLGHIKLILKYQRPFMIWNEDLTLNEENFNDLIAEIKEGLE